MVKATVDIVYEGKNVTKVLGSSLLGLRYIDKISGEADELEVIVDDRFHKWKGPWLPVKGDKVQATIISGDYQLPCGTFTVDSLHFYGTPGGGHELAIRALSAGVVDRLRTKATVAYQNIKLSDIAQQIARKYGYTVYGITHDFQVKNLSQWHETDLGFLHRISEEYGYLFTVKGTTLIFTYMKSLANISPKVTVRFTDLMEDYTINDKVAGVFVAGQYKGYSAKKKKVLQDEASAQVADSKGKDTLELREHVAEDEGGVYKVNGRLYKHNMDQVEIEFGVPGNPKIIAGNTALLEGWGAYSTKFFIASAMHQVDRGNNYVTRAVVKKVISEQGTVNVAEAQKRLNIQKYSNYLLDIIELVRALETAYMNGTADATLKRNITYRIEADLIAIGKIDSSVEADIRSEGAWDQIQTQMQLDNDLVRDAVVSDLEHMGEVTARYFE